MLSWRRGAVVRGKGVVCVEVCADELLIVDSLYSDWSARCCLVGVACREGFVGSYFSSNSLAVLYVSFSITSLS